MPDCSVASAAALNPKPNFVSGFRVQEVWSLFGDRAS